VSRRGPLIAGAAGLALAVLLIVFLVLPKLTQVNDARQRLEDAETQQQTLEARLRALEDAQASAPEAQATIADVDRQIPPTADVPGVILLMDNAAVQSSLDLKVFTPVTPIFDPATGLSRIDIQVNVLGTYFELANFVFRIETLPRAAKVLNVAITPDATAPGTLAMSATVQVYTSDTSAGPGSSPGPTTDVPPGEGV
jgi:type IV pilus assembly protein PilO